MKHSKKISEFIDAAFPKETYINYNERNNLIKHSFKTLGLTKEKLSNQIDIGIKNGYTVDEQLSLLKYFLKKMEHDTKKLTQK